MFFVVNATAARAVFEHSAVDARPTVSTRTGHFPGAAGRAAKERTELLCLTNAEERGVSRECLAVPRQEPHEESAGWLPGDALKVAAR